MSDFKAGPEYQGDTIGKRLPKCDVENPADLEAWFGSFGHFDFYRKLVVANTAVKSCGLLRRWRDRN